MRRIDPDDCFDQRVDNRGVKNLAAAMVKKLAEKRNEGRSGWHDPDQCTVKRLKLMLHGHLKRGDMVDIANFAMMLHNRGDGGLALIGAWAQRVKALKQTARALPDRKPADLTLRDLQTCLPWTVHYHHDFRASPMMHKDFGHALLHVTKACGKIAAVVNDAEHGGSAFKQAEIDRYIADLVVCALRMANTCPGRTIDLQRAVIDRIEEKNTAEIAGEKQ
jgi:hypothetical protein